MAMAEWIRETSWLALGSLAHGFRLKAGAALVM
jgi:hypothetical protein